MKIILVILLFIAQSFLTIASEDNKQNPKLVHIGYSIELFNSVDINDALVAIQLWSDQLIKEYKGVYKVQNKIFNTNQEIIDAFTKNELDIISLLSVTYFELDDKINLEPLLSSNQEGISGYEYVILARKENEFQSFSDLDGKSILFTPENYSKISNLWLKSKIKEVKGENRELFFSHISEATKPSKAILSIFFKKFEACLVPYFTYKTMIELNPQIKQEISIVEKSDPSYNGMVFVRKNLDNQLKEDFLEFIENLTISSSGNFLTSLFGVLDLSPYDKFTLKKTKKNIL